MNISRILLGGLGVVLTSLTLWPKSVEALPESEVLNKLAEVPIFAILDRENNSLRSHFFVNPQTIVNQFAAYGISNQREAAKLEVRPLTLANVYQYFEAFNAKNPNQDSTIKIIPDDRQLNVATGILRAGGQDLQDIRALNVPLFVVTKVENGQAKWPPFTDQNSGQPIIPFYLQKEDADSALATYQKSIVTDENLSANVSVVALGVLVEVLLNSDTPEMSYVKIVPGQNSLDMANNMLRNRR
jgi:hypothetical protein